MSEELPKFVIVTKRVSYSISELLGDDGDHRTMTDLLAAVDAVAKLDFGSLRTLTYEDENGNDITHADGSCDLWDFQSTYTHDTDKPIETR